MKMTHVDLTMMSIAYYDKTERGELCSHVWVFYKNRAQIAFNKKVARDAKKNPVK